MKKLNTGFIHNFLMLAVVLFLIVNLSACNVSGNLELTGDLRYDKLFK